MSALVQYPLGASGVNETKDPRQMQPGEMTTLENLVFRRDGTLDKRYGYTQIDAGELHTCKRLAVFRNELLALDGANLWSYSPAKGKFISLDQTPEPLVTHEPAISIAGLINSSAVEQSNGYRVYSWTTNPGALLYAAVVDVATGSFVIPPTQLDTASTSSTRIVVVGTTAVVLGGQNASIWGYSVSLANPVSFSAGVKVSAAAVPTGTVFGATALNDRFAVVYELGGNNLEIKTWTSALTLIATGTQAVAVNTFTAIGAKGTTGETIWAAFVPAGTNQVYGIGFNPTTLATTVARTAMQAHTDAVDQLGVERVSATQAIVLSGSPACAQWEQITTAAAVGTNRTQWNVQVRSAPFIAGGLVWALMMVAGSSYVLVDLVAADTTTANLVGRPVSVNAPRLASALTLSIHAPAVVSIGSSKYIFVAPLLQSGLRRNGIEVFTADFASSKRWAPAQLGSLMQLGGAQYDGFEVFETGFVQAPTINSIIDAGVGVVTAGSHNYVAVYEWIDLQGVRHQSAPSAPFLLAAAGGRQYTINVGTVTLTRRQRVVAAGTFAQSVYIVIYRTMAGLTTYFRESSDPPTATNDLNAASVNIGDNIADTTLNDGLHTTLYTSGGVLDNVCPPSFVHCCSHKNRLWGLADDERTGWFSQPFDPGTAPGWNEQNTFRVDDTPNKLTGFASYLDKLIVFTAREIYVVYGDGPSLSGLGSDLSIPQLISASIGCIDPRSIVEGEDGLYFQSLRGIEMLTLSLETVFVGDAISTTTATYPTCMGAAIVPGQSHVRFSFVSASTGKVPTWDFRRQRWCNISLTNMLLLNGTLDYAASSIVYHPIYGCVVSLEAPGQAYVWREDATLYTDMQAFVRSTWETGWIKVSDLQGYQRILAVMVLGERFTAHAMTIEVATDYGAYGTQSPAWTNAQLSPLSLEQLRVTPKNQLSESIRIRGKDSTDGTIGTGQSAAFNAIALEVLQEQGLRKQLADGAKR